MRQKWRPCAVGRRGGVKGAGQLKKKWRHHRVGREGAVEEWRVFGARETVTWYGRRLMAVLGGAATCQTSMGEGWCSERPHRGSRGFVEARRQAQSPCMREEV